MQAQPPQLQGAGAPGAAAGGAPCFDIAEAPGSPALLLGGLLQQRHHQHQQHAAQPVWLHATPSAAAAAGRPLASGAAAQRLREGLPSLHAPRSLNSAALGGSDVDEQQPEQQQQRPEERPPHEASGSSGAAERASWGRRLRRLAIRVGDLTQPSGEAPGDATWGERAANVLTSLPFLALGLHMHRCGACGGAACGLVQRPAWRPAGCRQFQSLDNAHAVDSNMPHAAIPSSPVPFPAPPPPPAASA